MAGPVPLGGHAAGFGRDTPMHVEQTTSGALRISSPAAPGWTATARTPMQLVHALQEGWREADIARYAASRRQPYDLTLHDQAAHEAAHARQISSLPPDPDARDTAISLLACSARPVTSTGRRQSTTTHDPLAWRELPDGRWMSPSNRIYRPDTQAVRAVREKRANAGIGTPPADTGQQLTLEQQAAPSRADELWARRDRNAARRQEAIARHPAGKARPSA